MENEVMLVKPTASLKNEYLSFYNEWLDSGENMVPWVLGKDPSDFEGMIQTLLEAEKGENLPANWVPDSTYWLINQNNRVLGAVNIRHSLTEKLLNTGGHIGYGIRPTERRKGYATHLLALSLEKVKELGISKVLVTCDESNIGSAKTILNNGGAEYDSFVEEDGNVVRRFWIKL